MQVKLFCDIESTGFCEWRNDIVSICLLVADEKLNIIDKYYDEIKPEFNKFLSEESIKVHGLSIDQMKGFKPRRQACIDILNFLKPYKRDDNKPLPFIYHALRNFDYRFLSTMFRKEGLNYSLWKVIEGNNIHSTIKMGRDAGFKKNGLDLWAERIGFNLNHHDAMSDTECCHAIYKHLTEGRMV